MKKTKTLIVGASGLVGGEILKCVSKENQEIFLLSRNSKGIDKENYNEIISDFDDIDAIDFPKVDHVYISIGKKLGSSELMYIRQSDRNDFIKIDCEYVLNIARKSFNNGAKSIAIVSAIGADKTSKNLYLQTKGNMEYLVKKIGFTKTIFAQPSHLLGKRVDEKFKLDQLMPPNHRQRARRHRALRRRALRRRALRQRALLLLVGLAVLSDKLI